LRRPEPPCLVLADAPGEDEHQGRQRALQQREGGRDVALTAGRQSASVVTVA